MFAASYDPFGFKHPLSPRPHAYEKRKREENARRQRMIEADRRRRSEEEKLLRLEKRTHQMETREQRYLEEEEEQLRHHFDLLSQRDDDNTTSFPPAFIYATVSKSEDEIDQDFATYPPRTSAVKTNGAAAPSNEQQRGPRRHSNTDSSTICTEENIHQASSNSQAKHVQEMNNKDELNVMENDNDDAFAPPHIIAVEDASDDDEDDEEDLDSIWRYPAPGPGQMTPNDSFQTYE